MELTDIRAFAENEISKHLDVNWKFKFISSKNFLGRCIEKDIGGIIQISMHHCLYSDEEYIRDTILHEIAHALAGCHNGHNDVWKEMAIRVGAKPEQYADVDEIKYRYYLVHEESKTIIDRSRTYNNRWVRNPEKYFAKDIPNSQGKLTVLTYEEALRKNYVS